MDIIVYSGFSKKTNSTKQPSGGTTKSVVLKNPTSVIRPTFVITGFDTSWNYIQWGNRYYFVDDIVILTDTQAAYTCSLDVLATYKTQIGSSSEYVVRADSAYNPLLIDTLYPTLANTSVENVEFSTIHSEIVNGGSFVIAISNGDSTASAGVTYYWLTMLEMSQLLNYMFAGTWLNAGDISVELQKELINPMQYIDSVNWFPFEVNNALVPFTPTAMKFGYWDSGVIGNRISANDSNAAFAQSITIPSHPQISRGNYLNGSPYTKLSLDCYSFGVIPIDSSIFAGLNTLTISIAVDLMSGIGKLTLRAGSSSPKTIYKTYSEFGVPMKISQVSQKLVGAAASVITGSFAAGYGNILGYASGVMSGLEHLMPTIQSNGTNGTKSAFINAPMLIITRQSLAPEDKSQLGRPLCDRVLISTLSGYIKCENVDIDSVGTKEEKNAIVSLMESGFFYE